MDFQMPQGCFVGCSFFKLNTFFHLCLLMVLPSFIKLSLNVSDYQCLFGLARKTPLHASSMFLP